jgi:nucleoside-diphosphate-sugar epimerase
MRVLLTGSFGNIGESTLLVLFEKGYEIRCFDLPTEMNKNKQRHLKKNGSFETIWGDILDEKDIKSAVENVDCIIHLAGIIPPLSEKNPD